MDASLLLARHFARKYINGFGDDSSLSARGQYYRFG
jgi:hypothetical protein